MHFHQNHCWCSQSHWNGKTFDATYMVSIERYTHGSSNKLEADWDNLITEEEVTIHDPIFGTRQKKTSILKPEVMDWLTKNVEDNKSSSDYGAKGWCIGNDEYRSSESGLSLTVFFYRRRDAMNFIKRWSTHKKPTTYLNYFKDDYRELVDGKLVKKERD